MANSQSFWAAPKTPRFLPLTPQHIDGTLNIITGKKGCGKSHLSKLLMVNLVGYKATVVIFDLNGEYSSLGMTTTAKETSTTTKSTP